MSEIIKKEHELSQANWINVFIIKEYLNYLNKEDINELSLVSKSIRFKLKPRIFDSIKFNGYQFDKYLDNNNSILWGHFDFTRYANSNVTVEDFDKYSYKNLKVETALKDFENRLSDLRLFVRSFNFMYVSRGGYYLIPLLNMFDNLTTLKLTDCIVPLIEFSKLTKSLKLESIDVSYTSFAKLPTEELTVEDIEFPDTLKNLSISTCNSCSDDMLSNPYEYLFDKASSATFTDFKLPSKSVPSLKSLAFETQYSNDYGSNEFLENNSQLGRLSFESTHLDQYKVNYIEKSKNLKRLDLICQGQVSHKVIVPTLIESINEFRFIRVNIELYPILEELCIFSPNLKELYFLLDEMYIDYVLSILDNIIYNIIPNAISLKVLCLCFLGEIEEPIDFTNLNQVKCLIIETNISNLLNIEFENSTSLKHIEFNYEDTEYDDDSIDIEDIQDKFLSIDGWKFEFNNENIKGTRV